MAKKSADKGKRYERRIAKILSEWSGIELVRTPMSGAWQGCETDIWPKDVSLYFPLAIECKCNESWTFEQIMHGVGGFYQWLVQARNQANRLCNKIERPHTEFLVFSKNFSVDYVCIRSTLFNVLYLPSTATITLRECPGDYTICALECILAVEYEVVRHAIEDLARRQWIVQ